MAAADAERLIPAGAAEIWAALTDGALWLPFGVATWEWVPGGHIEVRFPGGAAASGRVKEMDPGRRVVFTWGRPGWPAETTVTVELAAVKGGTQVHISHHHLRPDLRELYQRTWAVALEGLARQVGPDATVPPPPPA